MNKSGWYTGHHVPETVHLETLYGELKSVRSSAGVADRTMEGDVQ